MSLKIGQKIKHPQHGVGIVKSIYGNDAVVDFETGMEKEEPAAVSASIVKDDMPHEPNSPEDKAHDIVEEGDSIQQALAILDTPEKQKQMFEHLRTLVEQSEHRSDENQEIGQEPAGSEKDSSLEEVVEKKESCIQKSEYSAREVAIAVLKKAESMAREWQNSKPEKIMQDSVLSEKRDVVNENDIIDAASQAMTDKSPLRLKAWVEARKAKK